MVPMLSAHTWHWRPADSGDRLQGECLVLNACMCFVRQCFCTRGCTRLWSAKMYITCCVSSWSSTAWLNSLYQPHSFWLTAHTTAFGNVRYILLDYNLDNQSLASSWVMVRTGKRQLLPDGFLSLLVADPLLLRHFTIRAALAVCCSHCWLQYGSVDFCRLEVLLYGASPSATSH